MVGADIKTILARLPYVGLDIESVTSDTIRVEYSPNRPDFGTDIGIARALRGLMGKEVGLPKYPATPSGVRISVDKRLASVRPHIACAVVTDLRLDDEDIRQMISLQEDLHNGLGRKRRVAAIGIHDLSAIAPPLAYEAVGPSFSFVPLGRREPTTIGTILTDTPEGRAYGSSFKGGELFPVITDSKGTVLSFPPVINGSATRVTSKTKSLFIDVTSTDRKAGDDVLSVLATTLAEGGGKLGTVKVAYPGGARLTPDLAPVELPLDLALVKSVLGLDLSRRDVLRALGRSRLEVRGRTVRGPRYRVDLIHPVDIAEEVALGYGMDRISPVYPASERPGSFDPFEDFLDATSTVMAGSGMIELMTYELTDEKSLYAHFGRPADGKVAVQNPKSIEHSLLRDALVPTLLASLAGNIRADYPQRVFEIGRVYERTGDRVSERWHLGSLVAHSQASFTESKMYLEALCRALSGEEATASAGEHWAFAQGRCAAVSLGRTRLGFVGELKPEAVAATGLGVPVAGFEIDLTSLHESLK